MRCLRWLLLSCAMVAALASAAGRAQAQGCTAARGCPTLPPTIPGGWNLGTYDVMAQQEAEQLEVAPEIVDGQYSVSDLYDPQYQSGGGPFLEPGQWIFSYQWNYSEADKIFLHNDHLQFMDDAVALVSIQNEHVAGAEIGIAERL